MIKIRNDLEEERDEFELHKRYGVDVSLSLSETWLQVQHEATRELRPNHLETR